MSVDAYNAKIEDILKLPQFEKMVPKRKNEKHPVIKEEEKVVEKLKSLLDENKINEALYDKINEALYDKINEALYDKIKPSGSQAPRIYGLASP